MAPVNACFRCSALFRSGDDLVNGVHTSTTTHRTRHSPQGLSHAAGGPSRCCVDAFHGHGDWPKPAVGPMRCLSREDLDALQAGRDWIGSDVARGRDDRPKQETQQLPSGGVPAHCCCSQFEANEEWRSSCKPRFDSNILYRLIRNLR